MIKHINKPKNANPEMIARVTEIAFNKVHL